MENLKVIRSNTEPRSTNVVWVNGKNVKIFNGNGWESINSVESGNNEYDLFFDTLPNIVKLNPKDMFEPIINMLCRLTNFSRDEIIKELENESSDFFEGATVEEKALFMFMMLMIMGSPQNVIADINIKINIFDSIIGSCKVFNEIVYIKNNYFNTASYGNAIYAYIPEFDIYVGLVMPTSGNTIYLMHNLINNKGAFLNLDLNYGDDIDETAICNFNSFLYEKGIKYYYNNYREEYFRYVNSNYFYSLTNKQFYSLDLKTWELTSTDWKPFYNL